MWGNDTARHSDGQGVRNPVTVLPSLALRGLVTRRRVQPPRTTRGVIRGVQGAGTFRGGNYDALEPHTPPAGDADARLDTEGVPGLDDGLVSLHHVRILVLVHADSVAGTVHEPLVNSYLWSSRQRRAKQRSSTAIRQKWDVRPARKDRLTTLSV
jgi:hypothetical protein